MTIDLEHISAVCDKASACAATACPHHSAKKVSLGFLGASCCALRIDARLVVKCVDKADRITWDMASDKVNRPSYSDDVYRMRELLRGHEEALEILERITV